MQILSARLCGKPKITFPLLVRATYPNAIADRRFSSHISLSGPPLLALSLYVSTQNYTTTTRPLYNAILPFPLAYLIPPSVRAAAKERTAHLGFDALDIDSETGEEPLEKSIIPASLRVGKNSVMGMLKGSPESGARIRLDASARRFLEPLEDLREEGRWLGAGKRGLSALTSVDCLALGYLSLMLLPELPSSWLRTTTGNFRGLCAFVRAGAGEIYGGKTTPEDAFLVMPSTPEMSASYDRTGALPWAPPTDRDFTSVSSFLLTSLRDSIPGVSSLQQSPPTQSPTTDAAATDSSTERKQLTFYQQRSFLATCCTLVAGGGIVALLALQRGLLSSSAPERPRQSEWERNQAAGLGGYGEAGAALSALASQMDRQADMQRAYARDVEVDVDVAVAPDEVVRDRIV